MGWSSRKRIMGWIVAVVALCAPVYPSSLAHADRVKDSETMALLTSARAKVATAERIGKTSDEGLKLLRGARDELTRALMLSAGFEQAAVLFGEVMLDLGEHRQAIVPLELTLGARPESVRIRHLLGVHLFRLKRFAEGARHLELVALETPDQFDVSYLLAGYYYQSRQLARARRHAENYLRLQPRDAAMHGLLGNVHLLDGRRDEAISAFKRVLELDPQNIPVRVNLGNVLFQLKRYRKAIEIYEYVQGKRPDLALVLYNLGSCHYALDEWEPAAKYFEAFVKLEPSHARGHYYAGSSLAQLGRVQDAIARLARATLLDPDDPWAPFALARLAWGLGDLSTAESYVKTALERAPQEPDILFIGGLVARARQRYPEAVQRFERGVGLAPKRADLRAELGFARILSGQLDAGIDDLEGARTIEPGSERVLAWLPVARTRRAVRRLNAGATDDAERDLLRALEVAPALADAAWNLGLLYDGQGRVDDAIAMLNRVQSAQPEDRGSDPNLHLLTALMYVRSGRVRKAQVELQSAGGAHDAGLRWLVQGAVHGRFGEYDAAIAAFEQAAALGLDTAAALGFARLDKAAAQLADDRVVDALVGLRQLGPQLAPEQSRLQAALIVVGLLRQDRGFEEILELLPIIGGGTIPKGWGLERLERETGLLLGYLRYRSGNEVAAADALEAYLKDNPDDPRARRLTAVVLTDLAERDHGARRYKRAEERIRRAVELAGDEPVLQHNLGCVLYSMGHHAEAAKVFERLNANAGVAEATLNLALYYDDVAHRGVEAAALYRRYVERDGLASEVARRRLARKERIFGSGEASP